MYPAFEAELDAYGQLLTRDLGCAIDRGAVRGIASRAWLATARLAELLPPSPDLRWQVPILPTAYDCSDRDNNELPHMLWQELEYWRRHVEPAGVMPFSSADFSSGGIRIKSTDTGRIRTRRFTRWLLEYLKTEPDRARQLGARVQAYIGSRRHSYSMSSADLVAELGEALANIRRSRVYFTLNPLDKLCCSVNADYHSCFRPTGEYSAAAVAYAMSCCGMFVRADSGLQEGLHTARKVGRVWTFFVGFGGTPGGFGTGRAYNFSSGLLQSSQMWLAEQLGWTMGPHAGVYVYSSIYSDGRVALAAHDAKLAWPLPTEWNAVERAVCVACRREHGGCSLLCAGCGGDDDGSSYDDDDDDDAEYDDN